MLFFLNFYVSTHSTASTHPTDSSNRLIQPTCHGWTINPIEWRLSANTTAKEEQLHEKDHWKVLTMLPDVTIMVDQKRSTITRSLSRLILLSQQRLRLLKCYGTRILWKWVYVVVVRNTLFNVFLVPFLSFFFLNVLLLLFPIQPPPLLHLFLSCFFHSPSTEQRPEFNGTGVWRKDCGNKGTKKIRSEFA